LEEQGVLTMTHRDRDWLVVLKKVQKQAATELELSERHVRRLLKQLKARGDKAVIHTLRGRPSNRKLSEELRQRIVAILSQDRSGILGRWQPPLDAKHCGSC
jgi:transposase